MIEFTESQKRIIARGVTILSLAVGIAFVAVLAWGFFSLLTFMASALIPVTFGFFLALFFRPYYRWWTGVLHNPVLSLLVMLLTVFVPAVLVLWYAGALLVDQLSNLVSQLPTLMQQVVTWFQATFPKLTSLMRQMGIEELNVNELYAKYGTTALAAGSGLLKCLLGCVSALVTLIFFVFFLMTKDRRGGEITRHMPFLKAETQDFLAEQIDAFFEILVSFFQRQTVICLIEGLMYGCGFALVGLPYGFMIGFALGVLNLIPFFGSLVCLPVALPLAYFAHGGSAMRLMLVLAVWLAGQVLDGYFITPKIQGNKTGLGYVGVIFSFFFWSTVLGPLLGMLLAIPLSAFCVVFWRAIKSRYIRPVV